MITVRKAKHLDINTMQVTYSHANTPLGQSESAHYLSYFIIPNPNTVQPNINNYITIIITIIKDSIIG